MGYVRIKKNNLIISIILLDKRMKLLFFADLSSLLLINVLTITTINQFTDIQVGVMVIGLLLGLLSAITYQLCYRIENYIQTLKLAAVFRMICNMMYSLIYIVDTASIQESNILKCFINIIFSSAFTIVINTNYINDILNHAENSVENVNTGFVNPIETTPQPSISYVLMMNTDTEDECNICLDNSGELCKIEHNCSGLFHRKCLDTWFKTSYETLGEYVCPFCRKSCV